MKVTVVEGTPKEILELMPHLGAPKNDALVVVKKGEGEGNTLSKSDTVMEKFVTTEVARKVLKRRHLDDKPLAALKLLYDAHPKRVLATDLRKELKYSSSQLAGLMGAFGRRLSKTGGFIKGQKFFVAEWDHTQHCNQYGLPDSVREALEVEKMV